MPRWFVRSERVRREQRNFKVYSPWWVDPYWVLVGTSIEKMVMAELSRRGIFFIFRSQTNDLGGFVDPSWEADFLLPQHRIWIEVQGSYFHSLPGQIENDSLRYAAIEMAGWRPLFLWEFDIRTRLNDLVDEIPEFYIARVEVEQAARAKYGKAQIGGTTLPFQLGATDLTDQLVGLRKALSNRTKPPQYSVKRRSKRRPK